MEKLTDAEIVCFEAVTSGRYGNFALVRSVLDGEEVAVIASVQGEENGEYVIEPLYVQVTNAIFARLVGPASAPVWHEPATNKTSREVWGG